MLTKSKKKCFIIGDTAIGENKVSLVFICDVRILLKKNIAHFWLTENVKVNQFEWISVFESFSGRYDYEYVVKI